MGPDYQTPDSPVPQNWDTMTMAGETVGLSVLVGTGPEVSWWQVFQNEELNHLIEQLEE